MALRQTARLLAKGPSKFNWEALGTLMSTEAGKRELGEFQSIIEKSEREAALLKPRTIDWAAYKEQHKGDKLNLEIISMYEETMKGVEGELEKEYEQLRKEKMASIQATFAKLEQKAEALKKVNAARMEELDKEQKRLKEIVDKIKQGELTTEDVLSADTKLATEIDKELAEGKWL
mmetsp:Transcript_4797/g.17261  ORF Transcript_4797/g.17261 Transcript_4797/m.17261 type:complete len:176 (-) Transcript_4797:1825-2352(-)